MVNRLRQLISLAENLAVLLKSGADLDEAMASIISSQPDTEFKSVLLQVRQELLSGTSLDLALAAQPDYFDPFFCGMVKSGEASGQLANALQRMASQMDNEHRLKQQISTALVYPAILFAAMCVSVVLVMGMILPQLTRVFDAFNTELSAAAQTLLSIGNFVERWGSTLLWSGIIVLLIGFIFRQALQPKRRLMQSLQFLPPVKAALDQLDFARFSGSLASLLESGMPQTEALLIASQSFSQEDNRQQIENIAQQVKSGRTLGDCLGEVDSVSQLYAQSVANGERGGQLPSTLRLLAIRMERDFSDQAQKLAAVIEPALVIILGVVIAAVVYTLFSALQTLSVVQF